MVNQTAVVRLTATDDNGVEAASEPVELHVRPLPDCEGGGLGPNGRGCSGVGAGQCVDVVAFDGRYTCNCSGAVDTVNANCETVAAEGAGAASTSGGGLDGATIVGIAAGGAAVAVGLAVGAWMVRRRREADKSHDFARELAALVEQGLVPANEVGRAWRSAFSSLPCFTLIPGPYFYRFSCPCSLPGRTVSAERNRAQSGAAAERAGGRGVWRGVEGHVLGAPRDHHD